MSTKIYNFLSFPFLLCHRFMNCEVVAANKNVILLVLRVIVVVFEYTLLFVSSLGSLSLFAFYAVHFDFPNVPG